ncbi:MAG: S-layer protein [Candidatus Aenigmarchaeota archaeon]|nr:S-layer protein [Candidatus Aenigmarchaeota archaeon]
MKNIFGKIGAIALGALTTGASIAPAMAATYGLEDYPVPFVDNGNTNFLIVVGSGADPADVAGAINIAVRLGAERGEEVTCGGSGTVILGGEDKELALNEALSTFGTLKDNKLAGFQDDKLRWNSKDVDFEEQLTVTGIDIVTSDSDEDLGSEIYLGTGNANYQQFRYSYVIDDDDFDYTQVNTTTSKKLLVKFLGEDFEITGVSNGTTDSITFKFAKDFVLGVGDEEAVEGSMVKVNSIGSAAASVSVGGDTKIISEGDEYDFGDLTVGVNSILYTDDVESRQVDISIGSDIEKTVSDGDSMETFGEPEEENDAEWLWVVEADNSDTSKLTIGAKYNQKLLDHKDDLKTIGEYFALPENYAKVSITKFTTEDYLEITSEFDNYIDLDLTEAGASDTTTYTSKSGLVLTSDESETGFRVNASGVMTETDTVYLLVNGTNVIGAFDNSDNKKQIFYIGNGTNYQVTNELQVYYQDTALPVYFNNSVSTMAFTVKEGVEGDILWDVDLSGERLGDTQGQADAAELKIGGTNRGTAEDDYRTHYGLIIRDPDSNGDSDELAFAVPSEQIKATIVVEGPQTSVSTVTGSTVKKAVPIVDDIAKMDTEVNEVAKQTKNLILVGGPCVNILTANALGFSETVCGEEAAAVIPENAAIIKMVNGAFNQGKAALVVAGWDAVNTRAACSVLQQYTVYPDLMGEGVVVEGTTNPVLKALE